MMSAHQVNPGPSDRDDQHRYEVTAFIRETVSRRSACSNLAKIVEMLTASMMKAAHALRCLSVLRSQPRRRKEENTGATNVVACSVAA